jgi:hypothetical protein
MYAVAPCKCIENRLSTPGPIPGPVRTNLSNVHLYFLVLSGQFPMKVEATSRYKVECLSENLIRLLMQSIAVDAQVEHGSYSPFLPQHSSASSAVSGPGRESSTSTCGGRTVQLCGVCLFGPARWLTTVLCNLRKYFRGGKLRDVIMRIVTATYDDRMAKWRQQISPSLSPCILPCIHYVIRRSLAVRPFPITPCLGDKPPIRSSSSDVG